MSEAPRAADDPPLEPRDRLDELRTHLAGLEIGFAFCAAPPLAKGTRRDAPPGRLASGEAARSALRHLLSRRAKGSVSPEAWALDWSRSGRPLVRGPEPGFRTSIAYAPGLIAVAVAHGRAVGVDVEPARALPEDDIPQHLLSPAELALTRADPEAFLTIWTLKEALGKERGEGLLADCRTLDAGPLAHAEAFAVVSRPNGGVAVHCRLLWGGESYQLALAAGGLDP